MRIPDAATFVMPRKRRSSRVRAAEELVFPFQLRPGDMVIEDGARLEIVGWPTSISGGRMTHARVRPEGETVERDTTWEAWRKLHVVRTSAA